VAEPFELTVAEAAFQMRQGSLSPVELMQSLLARASALEPSLRVWVTLDEGAALAAAGRREAELKGGRSLGPLHGVPVGIKDIYYTRGVKTTACSPIYAEFVPGYDATSVALLKRAGAIIMGKTVTTELACMDPPPTRNPWNPAHTPGGSSSGSAVGVAARIFPAAMGSQTAGSVVRPASYNGVVGVKPTFGRISRHGVMPVAWSLDTVGYFTRTVEDAAILLDVLAGHDPKDSSSSHATVQDYTEALGTHLSPPRIGLARLLHERADPEVREHTEGVVRRLGDAGATVEEVNMSIDLDELLAAHQVIMAVEAASVHEVDFKARHDDYGPKVRSLIETGLLTPAVAYVRAQRVRRLFHRAAEEAVNGLDVLLSPSTPTPAPRDLSTTGDPVFQTPWTTCGFPAMTIPSGLSGSGLPLGIQMASAPFAEDTLLEAAQWCERVLDITLAPPVGA
jgi:aspartyl-tRNA(Asn)/glutamyl-tRNA(Gln) amidotransferase subunit A